MVSNVFCIIHGNFKIAIIDEKQKKIKEPFEKAYERTMMQQQGNTKTAQTQHESKRRYWWKACFHFLTRI